jgi:hypothetical protein
MIEFREITGYEGAFITDLFKAFGFVSGFTYEIG